MSYWFLYQLAPGSAGTRAFPMNLFIAETAMENFYAPNNQSLSGYYYISSANSFERITAHLRGRRWIYVRPDGTECTYQDAYCMRRSALLDGYKKEQTPETISIEEFKSNGGLSRSSTHAIITGDNVDEFIRRFEVRPENQRPGLRSGRAMGLANELRRLYGRDGDAVMCMIYNSLDDPPTPPPQPAERRQVPIRFSIDWSSIQESLFNIERVTGEQRLRDVRVVGSTNRQFSPTGRLSDR